ncbi:hypothetical protein OJ997_16360 [Solirubrobacter phytolaccae]|uniref:Uncharacterized protein n=1 Tax=Solirubrobacter phytolaccae TaxID=1404360 RepID=A0A9X3S8T3_9ACTN|nr:hypothetical protein [Solirubrobacter phytolaccae]MDA0181878.1 hypothetical protein [Solirubrobacter phytolaccae]
MPPEAEFHAAALDMLGAAPTGERMITASAVTYPAAVVEWFALGQLDELEVVDGRLRVAPEFHVALDEGEDPPVYHDEEGLVSLAFSSFAFDLAAAQRLRGQHLSARGPVPKERALTWLGEQLKPGPVTKTAGLEIHRFYGPHEYATVRWSPGSDAEWHLEADSPEALKALQELVDRVGGVPQRGLMKRLSRRRR